MKVGVWMSRIKSIICSLAVTGQAVSLLAAESDLVIKSVSGSTSGILIRIAYPDSFTNCLDVLVSTNLVSGGWQVLAENLVTVGSNTLCWIDTGATCRPNRFYLVGNAGLDTDGDDLPDARETLVHLTDPLDSDTDSDGYPDGAELNRGTDPVSGSSGPVTLYADSSMGHDSLDGLSASPVPGHGPKRSLGAIHAASYSGDVIELAGGESFHEPMLYLAGRDVVIRPTGKVVVCP